jgi:hypothetical protein
MATPPSMANPPAAIDATPLVTMVLVADRVVEGPPVTVPVMVAVVEKLPRMVDELRVDDGTEKLLVLLLKTVEVLVAELDDSDLVVVVVVVPSVAVALVVVVVSLSPLSSPPPTIWNGKPYWKMSLSDSRVIMMP